MLGTPRLLSWCEAVTCAAIEPALEQGQTSVGAQVSLEHRAASPVGARVHVSAAAAGTEGRRVVFVVRATHEDGSEVATGEITRSVVDAERFLARLS